MSADAVMSVGCPVVLGALQPPSSSALMVQVPVTYAMLTPAGVAAGLSIFGPPSVASALAGGVVPAAGTVSGSVSSPPTTIIGVVG